MCIITSFWLLLNLLFVAQIMEPVVQTMARDINKEAMTTNAKLFVAMGLTWIGEFVTGLYERNSAACFKDPDTCVHPAVKMVVNCMNIFLVNCTSTYLP